MTVIINGSNTPTAGGVTYGDGTQYATTAAGTSGQFLTSAGASAPTWTTITVSGSGGATASGNVTLTSASSGAQSVTPTTYGQIVTLPNATTMTKAACVFNIRNAGNYPVKLNDAAGTILGFIYPQSSVIVGLADNSTSAGVWTVDNLQPMAITAESTFTGITNPSNTIAKFTLDTDRMLIISGDGGNNLYGVVYNATTQTWGTMTIIRSAGANFAGYVINSTTVLVVSCNTTSAAQAVILSISGTTITVNTAANKTITGTIGQFYPQPGNAIIAVGSTYVVSFSAGTSNYVMGITISGTTPTVGAQVAVSGTTQPYLFMQVISSSVFLAVSFTTNSTIYFTPYSVSGTTITAGTGTTVASTTVNTIRAVPISSGARMAVMYANSTSGISVAICSVSGTTATVSTAVANANYAGVGMYLHDMLIAGNKAICYVQTSSNYGAWNIITDTAGTASAGTAIIPFVNTPFNANLMSFAGFFNSKAVFISGAQSGSNMYVAIDYSGSSAVASTLTTNQTGSSGTTLATFSYSNYDGTRSSVQVQGSSYGYAISTAAGRTLVVSSNAFYAPWLQTLDSGSPSVNTANFSANESWLPFVYSGGLSITLQRLECATI